MRAVRDRLAASAGRAGFALLVTMAVAAVGAAALPPNGASAWTRVAYGAAGAVVGFVAALVVVLLASWRLGPVRWIFHWNRDRRLGERTIILARELLELLPGVERLPRGAPLPEDLGADPQKDRASAEKLTEQWFSDYQGRVRASAVYEREYSGQVYRLVRSLHAHGHLTQDEARDINDPVLPPGLTAVGEIRSALQLMVRARRLWELGLRLGAKP